MRNGYGSTQGQRLDRVALYRFDENGKRIGNGEHWSHKPSRQPRAKRRKPMVLKADGTTKPLESKKAVVETANNTTVPDYMLPLHSTRNTSVWEQHNKHTQG